MHFVFELRSVAVIDASRNPARFGHVQLRNNPFGDFLSSSDSFRPFSTTSEYFEAISCYSILPIYSHESLS